jgi:hypothetical protein
MATKPAAPTTFTLVMGTGSLAYPAHYTPDPRRATYSAADYKGLTRGRDAGKTAAALREVADLVDADPSLLTLPAGVTTARLRQLADMLDADTRATADAEALLLAAQQLRLLNRDTAADVANDLLSMAKAVTRRDSALAARLSLLLDLNKNK